MKVVINKKYGGFGLSDEAVELCLRYGMRLTDYSDNGYVDPTADFVRTKDSHMGKYYPVRDEKELRINPIVVRVVEELGDRANGFCSSLGIVDIPFQDTHGWYIHEYDGYESIHEDHRSWD